MSPPATKADLTPELTPEWVAQTLGLTIPGSDPTARPAYTAIQTDSRKIVPGSLFVALPGETFDGHAFIDRAIAAGASGILHARGRGPEPRAGLALYAVPETLGAYRALGAAWRKEFSLPVIGVAGSVGKTTTKELLAAILSARGKVLKTEGSQNGFVGIPMTLLEIRPDHAFAVIEIGIDEIGAMAQHLPVVQPDLTLLTAIGPEHLEKLKDIPTVAREESVALTWTDARGGTTILNLDDPWIRPHARTLKQGRRVTVTLGGSEGDLKATLHDTKLRLPALSLELSVPLPGEHNARNLLIAIGAAHALGLTAAEITRGLQSFKGAYGRSEVRELKRPGASPLPVLCDYYNANPSSVEASLKVLGDLAKAKLTAPLWICLGDMLELGPDEEKFHRGLAPAIGQLAQNGRAVHVLLYGPKMKWLEAELRARLPQLDVQHFTEHDALAQKLQAGRSDAAAFLIKGSRGMRMEKVWEKLSAV